MSKSITGGGIFVAILGVLALSFMFGSWYTIDQTERGVVLQNGAFVEVVNPGLHFKLPWVQSVAKIDMQTHTTKYGVGPNGELTMEAYSKDQQPAHMRVSVTYHQALDKLEDFYSRFAGDREAAVARLIEPQMYTQIKNVLGQYTAAEAINDRVKLNLDSDSAVKGSLTYDPVFVIDSVQIEDIKFSPQYMESIEARMQAEVKVQQKEQELRQQKIDAEIAITQANGRAGSVRAEAEANAAKTIMIGDAEAHAIEVRAKALGTNPNLIELTKAEKWNGMLPTTMIPGSAVPFISASPQALTGNRSTLQTP